MNKGTRIRTVLAIFTTLNTILAVTDITQFGNDKLTLIYKIISVLVNAIVVGINTYYNNDYSEEACIGTGITRQLKAEKENDYIGEEFYDDAVQEYVEENVNTVENFNQNVDWDKVEEIEEDIEDNE